tara:strand:- start:1974 stop:2405 length:432 start_codon:yes stop_codon:yes gene_type:complete
MRLLNKKLTLKTNYECICEVNAFDPAAALYKGGLYEVYMPSVGKLSLDESQINTLFDLVEEELPSTPSITGGPVPSSQEKPKKVAPLSLQDRRRELLSSKKDELTATVADMNLKGEIDCSIKKALLVEEILKESFGEDYEAEG